MKHSRLKVVPLLAVALFVFGSPTSSPAEELKYIEPRTELLEINAKALPLRDDERKKIAGDLVAWLCKSPAQTQAFYDQATRVLSVALALQPEDRAAVLANARLRGGRLPDAATLAVAPDPLAADLRAKAAALLKPISRDCARMAGYFLMLASEVAPKNDEILYELEMFKKKNLGLTWDVLFASATAEPAPVAAPTAAPRPVPRGDVLTAGIVPEFASRTKPFARSQASVKGLFVRTLPTVGQTGLVLDIIATVFEQGDPGKITAEFTLPVGEEMNVSWNEALRVLQTRYPHWQPGRRLSFSFSDKYSPKDGGSAGVAFCMLLWSLLDGVELDPECSVTGDVTVDWKVRPVGGIGAKVRGATLDKSRYVLIPKTNERQLEDAVLINSGTILWQIQILTIDDLAEASAMMRKDRNAKAAEALKLFAGLQAKAKVSGTSAFRTPEAQQTLRTVCQELPNHASAKLLLEGLANQLPAKLTLGATVEETMTALIPALPFLAPRSENRRDRVLLGGGDSMANARRKLERLRTLADDKGKPLQLAALQCLKAAEEYKLATERASKSTRSTDPALQLVASREAALQKACEALENAFVALQTDKAAIETLLRP